jgi:sialidase-1
VIKLPLLAALWTCCVAANPPFPGATIIPLLPPGPGNPRNTEGAFVTLRDGRILFAYSHFSGGGGDNDAATIVGRFSSDRGRTWTATDVPIVDREGDMNVMSVSLLRLQDKRIALFYIRKNSVSDCRPYLRYSSDETKSWSEPVLCIRDEGYFVLNNDRAVQLRSGRILLPVALHRAVDGQFGSRGVAMTYFSDDSGKSWRKSRTSLECPTPSRAGLQEPGVVELKDGRVLMFIRTQMGSQFLSWSSDGGDSWSDPKASNIASPLSPATIKRIPKTGDLLMAWNDHSAADPSMRASETGGGKRTPFTVAISRDDGRTWIHARNLLDDPEGWYCYTAMHFSGTRVLLGFNAGGHGLPRLSRTSIAWFDVKQLYREKAGK